MIEEILSEEGSCLRYTCDSGCPNGCDATITIGPIILLDESPHESPPNWTAEDSQGHVYCHAHASEAEF
jgi:hypothetical protein